MRLRAWVLVFDDQGFLGMPGQAAYRRHESVGPARSGASNFLEILEISQFFGNRFWPFSGLFRPPPGPGRSQDVAMIHGYVLASPRPRGRPKKGRKRPKTISKKIQNFTENFQNPYFSFPRLWFPHLRFSEDFSGNRFWSFLGLFRPTPGPGARRKLFLEKRKWGNHKRGNEK